MPDTGVLYPGTVATSSAAPYDDHNWTNPDNIKADDGVNVTMGSSTFDTNFYSYILKMYNFGAAVPAGSTIDGIKVEFEFGAVDALGRDAKDVLAQLSKDNAARVGSNYAQNLAVTDPILITYGGAADLWGTTWTPAEVNANTFAFHYVVQAVVDNVRTYPDFMRVTIYYTEAVAGTARNQVVVIG